MSVPSRRDQVMASTQATPEPEMLGTRAAAKEQAHGHTTSLLIPGRTKIRMKQIMVGTIKNMKTKIMLSFVLLLASMMTFAQSGKPKTIELKDGSSVSFNESDIDSVRVVYLYGAEKTDANKIGLKVYVKGKESQDFLFSQIKDISYYGSGGTTEPTNPTEPTDPSTPVDKANVNKNATAKNKYAYRLEFPKLYSGSDVTYEVTHTLSSGSYPLNINYSIEWDGTKKANRWSCYFFCDGNKDNNTGRQDSYGMDPSIPDEYEHTLADYSGSGFSRGHLCPSGDRLESAEANDQTFYLTNMQPQWQAHNGGLWNKLEIQVRSWASMDGVDTLYVVKAATIDKSDQYYAEGTYKFPGIVPKYFYMAVLAYNKTSNTYHAIGIWTEHTNTTVNNTNYGDYAITIDELEKRTGIDFFCNLPDSIEDKVEQELDLTYWGISKSK